MKRFLTPAILLVFAFLGVVWWVQFALPRYQYIDLSVKQDKALEAASGFLMSLGVDTKGYQTAVIFESDDGTDRYLQRTIGILPSQKLIKEIDYDLFGWLVRFFKEQQKEEFQVFVSSRTGKVIGYSHVIDESESRPFVEKDSARLLALNFLKYQFGFSSQDHLLHSDNTVKQLNRTDYRFSWESTKVNIPWDPALGGGSAKLITSVTVSGKEILSFTKANFDIPDGFERYVDNLKQTGRNLTLVFRIVYLCLLTMAIMLVVNNKHHFVPRIVRSFYVRLGIVLYILLFIEVFNSFQYLLFEYSTTQAFGGYVVRRIVENLLNPLFIALAFIVPGLAGESLRFEVDVDKKNRGFLSPILSSFFSASTARSIVIGYALCAFILGVQSFIYDIGYHYCGVWEELSWLSKASSSAFPAVTAMMIAFQASFSEETMFRLFGINLLRRYRLGAWAVVLTALMWGVGHTGYQIYPMWFRGLEVTCLGIILGFAYLRFGLVAVITAHYLMDAFLSTMPYLLVPRMSIDCVSSVIVLLLPLLIALIARLLDHSTEERQWEQKFNAQQLFNYNILLELASNKSREEQEQLKADLVKHGWDPAVVEKAFQTRGNT